VHLVDNNGRTALSLATALAADEGKDQARRDRGGQIVAMLNARIAELAEQEHIVA